MSNLTFRHLAHVKSPKEAMANAMQLVLDSVSDAGGKYFVEILKQCEVSTVVLWAAEADENGTAIPDLTPGTGMWSTLCFLTTLL